MKKPVFVAVVALVSVAWGQSKTADPSVFGVRLGDALSIQECNRPKINNFFMYEGSNTSICYKRRIMIWEQEKFSTPITTEMIDLVFPTCFVGKECNRPSILDGSEITAQIIDGKLEWIAIPTHGLRDQEEVLTTLKEKYGEPAGSMPITAQNGFGATFSGTIGTWKFENLDVYFSGIHGRADSGVIEIGTKAGTKFRTAMLQPKGPKL
jgi:hypothetical protein